MRQSLANAPSHYFLLKHPHNSYTKGGLGDSEAISKRFRMKCRINTQARVMREKRELNFGGE